VCEQCEGDGEEVTVGTLGPYSVRTVLESANCVRKWQCEGDGEEVMGRK